MKDYRLKENRKEYFDALYHMNLKYGSMPGMVYSYMPELKKRLGWSDESALWFAFLNGMTQNPITSLRMFNQLPVVPNASELERFEVWFNANWDTLQFDTDRRYQKKDTVSAIKRYAELVTRYGSQVAMFTGRSFADYWKMVKGEYMSFGRLSSFSYLEYVRIMGFGADCDNLMYDDVSGSKSHRNGTLVLLGLDELVYDKRANNGFDGKYDNFKDMCGYLENYSAEYIDDFNKSHTDVTADRFTLESQYCQFKNNFFGRRHPGCYSDMALDRIKWYDERDLGEYTSIFKQIREDTLPDWLRLETTNDKRSIKQLASIFPETGFPFRGEHIL